MGREGGLPRDTGWTLLVERLPPRASGWLLPQLAPFPEMAASWSWQELMDRQQFEVVLQAQAGGRIVARETLRAFRKNVLAKCYGGDVSR